MKIERKAVVFGAWLIILFWAGNVFAFYNPSTGRWLSRDPIGEPGFLFGTSGPNSLSQAKIFNLYTFVANAPISQWDHLGLEMPTWKELPEIPCCQCPYADPCAEAKKRGWDNGAEGGVICCGGKAYPCVFNLPVFMAGPGAAKGKEIITKCILAHENSHAKKGCTSCAFYLQQFWKWRSPQEECDAYYTELRCLRAALSQCGGDHMCEETVKNEIETVAKAVIRECGKANN
jgi:RHS repeat-associated protein